MADINIGKAPSGRAVLPFYTTGAIAFFCLCVMMLLSPASLTMHYFNPNLLAIVHMAALGWGTMIIFGSAHQLLPVICEQDLFSEKIASFSWYTLTAGVAILVYCFWNFFTGGIMIAGGSLVVISALLYAINVLFTSKLYNRYTIQKVYLINSALWLLFTMIVGLLLAINLSHPFFSKNHLDILKLHAHAGLAGWFLQLIAGVSSKLVPMFLLAKSPKEYLLKYALILQNASLILFISDGYFFALTDRVLIYAVIMFAGIACWLFYLFDAYKKRIRKKIDIMMRHTFVSFACLLTSLLLIPAVWLLNGCKWAVLYGTFLFMGWITGIILGKTFKTLPFIVWNEHYKNLSGKVKVPMPKHLYDEKLVTWQFWFFISAILLLGGGIITSILPVIQIALGLWLTVAVLYCYNVIKILLHKTKVLQ